MSRHTGLASLPLHGGKAPPWLFSRMVLLSREIIIYMVREFGARDVLRRLSDPFWFQAFGCVLGFDWHSSGVTTTVCGAVKEGIKDIDGELGFFAAGEWCVVQQGMSDQTRLARRYHWLSVHVESFVDEPHEAVCCDVRQETLNLVAHENAEVRSTSAELARQPPSVTLDALVKLPELTMPVRHTLFPELDVADTHLYKILLTTYEQAPRDFEALLGIRGVGPKTVRALALASELVHGKPASLRDPGRFAFAHGGKDGTPFPVDRARYDRTIEILGNALNTATIDRSEKVKAFRRLGRIQMSSDV